MTAIADSSPTPTPQATEDRQDAPEQGSKRSILVAVDNSEASERACKWAADNLARPGDTIHLMHVVEQPLPGSMIGADLLGPVYTDPDADQKEVDRARRFINSQFVPLLQDIPHKVEVLPYCGIPGQALCERGKDLNADALVMASHNKGLISRFLLGSTSDYCSKHSSQPVVITR